MNKVKTVIIALALLLGAQGLYAQRLLSVEVRSQSVRDGKKTILDKELFYRKDGNFNIRYNSAGREYYTVTSPYGFTTLYYPDSNQSMMLGTDFFKPEDEILYLFATGSGENLGLEGFGFVRKSVKRDGPNIVRRYEPREKGGKCAWVELVSDSDRRPVYCAYYDKKGKILTKTYLSKYTTVGGFTFPSRVTEITYDDKRDSTVRLDLYKNLQVDAPNDMFDYHIPSGAVPVDLKEGLKQYQKAKK